MIRIHPKVSGTLARGDAHGLRAALQAAIELEHAVIPPYLYALYSLAPDGNRAVASIIRSVVNEEMLHLTLAANILNAVGGRPVLDSPDVLPRYPARCPARWTRGWSSASRLSPSGWSRTPSWPSSSPNRPEATPRTLANR